MSSKESLKSPTMKALEQSQPKLTASITTTQNATTHTNQHDEEEAFRTVPNNSIALNNGETVVAAHEINNENTNVNDQDYSEYSFDYFDTFPPGYRFCPFDDELIIFYLKRRVINKPLPHNKIMEVNLYKHNPEELSEKYSALGEKEWYFFTPRDRKYRNGSRPNRRAGSGYWKATGADKPIKFRDATVGFRKALVFYEGKPPRGDKTNWIMHEYRVNEPPRSKRSTNDMRLDDWVLCRIYKKANKSYKNIRRREEDQGNELYGESNSSHVNGNDHLVAGMNCDYNSNGMENSNVLLNTNYCDYPQPPPPFMDSSLQNFANFNGHFQSIQPILPVQPIQSSLNNYGERSICFEPNTVYCTENNFESKYLKEDAAWVSEQRGFQDQDDWGMTNYIDNSCDISSQLDFSANNFTDPFLNFDYMFQNNVSTNNPPNNPPL